MAYCVILLYFTSKKGVVSVCDPLSLSLSILFKRHTHYGTKCHRRRSFQLVRDDITNVVYLWAIITNRARRGIRNDVSLPLINRKLINRPVVILQKKTKTTKKYIKYSRRTNLCTTVSTHTHARGSGVFRHFFLFFKTIIYCEPRVINRRGNNAELHTIT